MASHLSKATNSTFEGNSMSMHESIFCNARFENALNKCKSWFTNLYLTFELSYRTASIHDPEADKLGRRPRPDAQPQIVGAIAIHGPPEAPVNRRDAKLKEWRLKWNRLERKSLFVIDQFCVRGVQSIPEKPHKITAIDVPATLRSTDVSLRLGD